jgi:methionyl-tRNA synthetase
VESLGLSIDRFKRTTDPAHHKKVQELFLACKSAASSTRVRTRAILRLVRTLRQRREAGDPCPDCGRPTETVTEENYYFKLSAFQDKLLELYEEQPGFVQPDTRRNEVIAFVKEGLKDLSISRTSIKWGIPVPGEEKHVFYVWFDALTTYYERRRRRGPLAGRSALDRKEIVRFHAIYWPAFLMAAGLGAAQTNLRARLPAFRQREDVEDEGESRARAADPAGRGRRGAPLLLDARSDVRTGRQLSATTPLLGRYNSDLANGLGNLVSRTLSMITQYRKGALPPDPAM